MSTHFEIEPIGRLWRLALPLIIANISTPILGLADAAISGHLDHAYYLAAVTVGAELLVVFFGAFSFLRMGTTGMVAQAVGANDHNLSFSILSHAIAFAAIIGIGLFVLGSQAITPILELAKAPAEMHRPLEEYLETRLWGAPANLALLVLTGWFIGKGHTQIALYLAISINLLNICLNYTLAIGYQMNSFGIALGTVISEYVGLIVAFTILSHWLKKYEATTQTNVATGARCQTYQSKPTADDSNNRTSRRVRNLIYLRCAARNRRGSLGWAYFGSSRDSSLCP